MSNILKYKLLELKKNNKDTIRNLATKCQVTEMGMRKWIFMPINHQGSIPSDKLKILADHFGLTMEELYTESELVTT